MPFSRLNLQARIVIIISITVICVVSVSTAIAMVLTRQLVEEEIYRKALAQARATAQQLVSEGALTSSPELVRILRQMQSDFPSVQQSDVYLHLPNHRLIATTVPGGTHLELDDTPGIERYYEFERPDPEATTIETSDGDFWIMGISIRDRGQTIGCLNLKVSKLRSSLVTTNLVLRNLVLMLASLTVVFVVIHVFFLRNVRRPMREMVRVMESAEVGQLDVRVRAPRGDETGQLAEHLNRMLDRIENFSTELAKKIEEATWELAQRNEELRRINEELFETQKKLARSERLAVAGQLAASLAHEIGTPLNSISGHVQLLARRKTSDEVTDRRLKIIQNQIENIVRSVKRLLAWTHRYELRIESLDLRSLLDESVILSSPALELRKIHTSTEWPEDFPQIYGDAGYLQQVFLNLINNSMDAMPRGGELRFRLRHPVNGNAREVAVEVEDTGDGIAPEMLSRIFEPMFTTKRPGSGTGLGLAISEEIIRQHGGSVRVESERGRGTRFTITLPVDCRERVEVTSGTFDPAAVPSD